MKRLQIIFLITMMLFTASGRPASALFGVGDIVFDPKAEVTRMMQFAKEIFTGANTYLTSFNTTISMVNQTIFRPLQDMMMLVSILKSSNGIKNLVLGSVGGQTSLLITNPQFYLKQQGVNSLKVSFNSVSKADGVYSNSILNSVIATARTKSDPEGSLANCSKSSVPTIIKNDLCSEPKLTDTAINDVKNADGTYDIDKMKAKRKEINDKLCTGDPNTDKTLAGNLTTAGNVTGAGGWDKFLAKTSGDNNYTQTSNCLTLIGQEQAAKIAEKAADLQRGNGVVSKTECLLKSVDPISGVEGCAEESITQAGYQLSEAFKSAINAPLDVLKNSYGTGGAFSAIGSLLGTVGSLLGNINAIRNTVSSAVGSVSSTASYGGVGGDPRLQITPKGQVVVGQLLSTTTPTPIGEIPGSGGNPNNPSGSTSYTQDLINAPVAKQELIKPILSLLELHSSSLIKVKTVDEGYILSINQYASLIEDIHTCYQGLITDFPKEILPAVTSPGYFAEYTFPSVGDDQRVITALSYYQGKKDTTDALRIEITREIALVATTTKIVDSTKSIITNSNSTQEISDTFEKYTSLVENNNLPNSTTGAKREGEAAEYKSKIQEDTVDIGGMVGDIPRLNKQCVAIRTEEQAKREAKRQERQDAMQIQGGGGP